MRDEAINDELRSGIYLAESCNFALFSLKSWAAGAETDHAATVRQFLPMLADDSFKGHQS